MKEGRFIAIVGPSGAGKDSVIEELCAARPEVYRARRVITRPADAGGEDFEAVTFDEFEMRVAEGQFALHWQAHGLSYGVPASVDQALKLGQDVVANLSRGMVDAAASTFDDVVVLHVTASPKILAQRLSLRGRESGEALAKRLARPAPVMPGCVSVIPIDNSGTLSAALEAALNALYPESA